MIAELFENILDTYNVNPKRKIDSYSDIYNELVRKLPNSLRLSIKDENLVIKGSMGQGNRTEYPWISLLNGQITTSTQRGIYIVYLFRKDMSGFYLSLDQGITYFEDKYANKKYEYANKMAEYFREQIGETIFSSSSVELGGKKGDLGYGYEKTSVLSKFYPKGQFNDEILIADLTEMISIYNDICKHIGHQSYSTIISNVLGDMTSSLVKVDDAIDKIRSVLDADEYSDHVLNRTIKIVEPYVDMSNKFHRFTNQNIKKVDYIKKAKRNAEIGFIGETIVMQYEKKRLTDIGLEQYIEKIEWVSEISDGYGYDIQSYDLDQNGKIIPIYIEVKTTNTKIDTEFYVSKNEVKKSEELKKQYAIYRLYDLDDENPKMYRVFGQIKDNFFLNPETYMARYKYPKINKAQENLQSSLNNN